MPHASLIVKKATELRARIDRHIRAADSVVTSETALRELARIVRAVDARARVTQSYRSAQAELRFKFRLFVQAARRLKRTSKAGRLLEKPDPDARRRAQRTPRLTKEELAAISAVMIPDLTPAQRAKLRLKEIDPDKFERIGGVTFSELVGPKMTEFRREYAHVYDLARPLGIKISRESLEHLTKMQPREWALEQVARARGVGRDTVYDWMYRRRRFHRLVP